MPARGSEAEIEEFFRTAQLGGGSLPQIGEEGLRVSGDCDYRIGRAIPDEGRTALRIQSIKYGATVAEKFQGLIGNGLAHVFTARVPVAARTVKVAAAHKDTGMHVGVDRARERTDKRTHRVTENGNVL